MLAFSHGCISPTQLNGNVYTYRVSWLYSLWLRVLFEPVTVFYPGVSVFTLATNWRQYNNLVLKEHGNRS